MASIQKLLRTAVQYHASDLYISTGTKPVLRVNGELIFIEEVFFGSTYLSSKFNLGITGERAFFLSGLIVALLIGEGLLSSPIL